MGEKPRWSYIATCRSCGEVYGATVDDPEYPKDTACIVAEWIKEGGIVERVESKEVRKRFSSCRCLIAPEPIQGALPIRT